MVLVTISNTCGLACCTAEDVQALRDAGARVISGPESNRFASEVPHWDRIEGPYRFYRMNSCFCCVKGRAVVEEE